MRKILFLVCATLLAASTMAQSITLKFTSKNNAGDYVRMDSVKIENVTHNWAETLVYPDTILRLKISAGIESPNAETNSLKAFPNPFNGKTNLGLQLANNDDVALQIFNFAGQKVAEFSQNLEAGDYLFDLSLKSPQVYLAVLSTSTGRSTIKMVNRVDGGSNSISIKGMSKITTKSSSNQHFSQGNEMRYTAYCTENRRVVASSPIQQTQYSNENFTLVFTTRYVPTLTTNSVSGRTDTSARCGGNISSDGGCPVTERGICFSTNQNPTISDNVLTDTAVGTGSFTCQMLGLTPGTNYYVRAYAKNLIGIAYGDEKSFVSLDLPVVTTDNVTNITNISANCSATVVSDGGASVSSRGFCYSTNHNPTIADNRVVASTTGTGSYSCSINTFSPRTTYYIRAYATNSVGTTYGAELTFTTLTLPTVSTDLISNITPTTATCAGSVTDDGGATVTARGICYSTVSMPTINNNVVNAATAGLGSFSCNLSNLDSGTVYYVRAFATNSVGTNYGSQLTFTTQYRPVVLIDLITNITNTSANCRGIVQDDGGATITQRGICYDTTHNPTTANNTVVSATAGTGAYVCAITNLLERTTYYVRPYAISSVGISYGTEWSFTTKSLPLINTNAVTNLTDTSATCGGVIRVDAHTPAITARGICYSTSHNPTILNTTIPDANAGAGSFTCNITGLTTGVTYYVRAYATHSIGTTYGDEVTFRTNSKPVVTTDTVTNITNTTASCTATLQIAGGSTVTERGVCYSTSPNPISSGLKVVASGNATGSYTCNLSSLNAGTRYYVRAYATNAMGTSYGANKSFVTRYLPTVNTDTTTNITGISATCQGTVVSDAGHTISACGICYSLYPHPTLNDSVVLASAVSTGVGTYSCNLIYLSLGTTYYYRAFATNADGTTYGVEKTFTTIALPTLITDTVSSITTTTATCGGTVLTDGGDSVTICGVCFDTLPNPTVYGNNIFVSQTAGLGHFTCSMFSLTPGRTYYVRAYAINAAGMAYGQQVSFIALNYPTVTTNAISNITSTTATCGGNVTFDGGASVTARGVCWSTSQNPTIADSHTNDGTGTGAFTSNLTNLIDGTTYYVRAYVTNSIGTSYGAQVSFTTSSTRFSVSVGTQVRFSPGNLQWSATNGASTPTTHVAADGIVEGTWRFAEHQWDFVGDTTNGTVYANGVKCNNAFASSSYTGWIDLFGWGTSGYNNIANDSYAVNFQPWATSETFTRADTTNHYGYGPSTNVTPGGPASLTQTAGDISNSYYDWGVYNAIYNPQTNTTNPVGTWRTLTNAEWRYLFDTRTASTINGTANARYAEVKVNGVSGIMLFPDMFTWPDNSITKPTTFNTNQSNWNNVNYTTAQFTAVENAGVIFLPIAGYRTGTSVYNVDSYGYYWSASYYDVANVYSLYFGSVGVFPLDYYHCDRGFSVRLVKNAN